MNDLVGTSDNEIAICFGVALESRPLQLEFARGRLQLRDTREGAPGAIFVDANSDDIKRRVRAGRELPLLKAVLGKAGAGRVVDATAGLGRDSFVLAYTGVKVVAIESNPVISALLGDGIDRSRLENLTVTQGDSKELLREVAAGAVVYLDPMFPARQKQAAVKKEMQYLQQLELPETNEQELIDAARSGGAIKIVIKRPAKLPVVGDKPNHSIGGKTVRFDVYL
jgi:16S rRNA (guanine1516-N2)-methyltransferase